MAVVRWTDEMLDELASSTSELKSSVSEMHESITEMRQGMGEMRESITEMRQGMGEMRESITEMRDSIDGLRVTSQALLQVAAQSQRDMELLKQRQAENDQRFNILLEEVRHLNSRMDEKEGL